MIDSNLIWIGCQDEACLGNLSVAFPSLKSAAPGSMLLGNPIEDEFSLTLATRLAKKYSQQFWISAKLETEDQELALSIEVELRKWLSSVLK
ncbi:hypothetical protein DSO57_1003441 [Entomophthora muscae]|uniref:Uncharacterized protein n=1 Tax=Entomophthora muscae TaxID=34485 RepID=A0ACC2UIC4_9FUNG|nr:hypothetical protein DSO57_1003441 [Entomophthora muscae]